MHMCMHMCMYVCACACTAGRLVAVGMGVVTAHPGVNTNVGYTTVRKWLAKQSGPDLGCIGKAEL